MQKISQYRFWFITGSQHLYGEETLRQVADHSRQMVSALDADQKIVCPLEFKPVVTTAEAITQVMQQANVDPTCAGVIVWMHTFSPSKMWIQGLSILQKPYLHLHTQFNREIPDSIDMDFMNLNQSAHGDREHGFIAARLCLKRKIVVGHWDDGAVKQQIGVWMRAAVGAAVSRSLKVARFGDNMRDVAVTEGDKVEVQLKLGWSVNTYGVGQLAQDVAGISQADADALLQEYRSLYQIRTDNLDAVRYQARIELALERFLSQGGFGAFTTTFEDLYGLEQLPGLACQRLMAAGYGFGGEGDWKVSAMTHIMKQMAFGLERGTSFMEDYTYDLTPGKELVLGAHMLEVCPTLAATQPAVEVHELGIGGKAAPARLVFEGDSGSAVCASLVDMGGRLRLIVADVQVVKPTQAMPLLPVARIMWKPLPDLHTSAHAWLLAGGAHHTVLSFALTADHLRDWAEIMDIEFVHIHQDIELNSFKQQLMLNHLIWKLK